MRTQPDKQPFVEKLNIPFTETPTIHIIHILDGSGSMQGAKFNSAKRGIQEELQSIKTDNLDINYTYTIVEFDSSQRIKTICSKKDPKKLNFESIRFFNPCGMTALYDAIGNTLSNFDWNKEDKVIVKIFTDGMENDSVIYTKTSLSKLINSFKELGWVITFVGTEHDTQEVIKNLKIEASNTFTYDGTASGLSTAYSASTRAMSNYSKAVLDNVDTNINFYKN